MADGDERLMGGRKKNKRGAHDEEPAAPKPVHVGTSLRGLLRGVEAAPPAPPKKKKSAPVAVTRSRVAPPAPPPPDERPSETLHGHDRTAWLDAFAGVRPLVAPTRRIGAATKEAAPISAAERDRDAVARRRLGALVAGGVRFDVSRDAEGAVEGVRRGDKRAALDRLYAATPERTLDLHGARASDVEARVTRWVREQARAGVRRVRIVHGKGLHSAGGVGVLGDEVVRVLVEGAAAPVTIAFVTAPDAQGGTGALLVELDPRLGA